MSLCSFCSRYPSLRYSFKEICFSCDKKCRTAFLCSIRYCSSIGYYKIRSSSIEWLSYITKPRAVAVRFIQRPDRLWEPVSPPSPMCNGYRNNFCIFRIRGKGITRYRSFLDIRMLIWGPGERSRYRDSLRVGWSGDRIPEGVRFSATVQTGPGGHPASYTTGMGSFPGVKRPGRGVDHPPHLASRLKNE